MEDLEGEIWKPIIYKGIDYTGLYEVSNMGRIKSVGYGKEKILNPTKLNHYKAVTLYCATSTKIINIHRLVANAFVSEIKTKQVVDHKNSNPLDNRAANLRIVSHRENASKERVIRSNLPCGVSLCRNRAYPVFQSTIDLYGKDYFFGCYKNKLEAAEAYQIALSTHEQGKSLIEVFKAVDKYRESINLKPIKRRNP